MGLSIMDTINKWAEDLKNLFASHTRDPIFMVLIVIIAFVFFIITYKLFNKD